jgi:hypothetical protein
MEEAMRIVHLLSPLVVIAFIVSLVSIQHDVVFADEEDEEIVISTVLFPSSPMSQDDTILLIAEAPRREQKGAPSAAEGEVEERVVPPQRVPPQLQQRKYCVCSCQGGGYGLGSKVTEWTTAASCFQNEGKHCEGYTADGLYISYGRYKNCGPQMLYPPKEGTFNAPPHSPIRPELKP